MRPHRSLPLAALAAALLTGQVTDKTTGQPLTGVRVVLSGPTRAAGRTNDHGSYRIAGLRSGDYTVTLSSDDVPPQTFTVTLRRNAARRTANFVACSTTLDFHCGGGF